MAGTTETMNFGSPQDQFENAGNTLYYKRLDKRRQEAYRNAWSTAYQQALINGKSQKEAGPIAEAEAKAAAAAVSGGRRHTRRRTLKASTLRRMLKKKGKKTTGKKATLLKRLKE